MSLLNAKFHQPTEVAVSSWAGEVECQRFRKFPKLLSDV